MSEQQMPPSSGCSSAASRFAIHEATIGDLTRLVGLTARAIRFYEERGLVTPSRDRINRRRFSWEDRARLQVISLLRNAGLRIEEIRLVLTSPPGDAIRMATTLLERRSLCLRDELAAVGLARELLTSSGLL